MSSLLFPFASIIVKVVGSCCGLKRGPKNTYLLRGEGSSSPLCPPLFIYLFFFVSPYPLGGFVCWPSGRGTINRMQVVKVKVGWLDRRWEAEYGASALNGKDQ